MIFRPRKPFPFPPPLPAGPPPPLGPPPVGPSPPPCGGWPAEAMGTGAGRRAGCRGSPWDAGSELRGIRRLENGCGWASGSTHGWNRPHRLYREPGGAASPDSIFLLRSMALIRSRIPRIRSGRWDSSGNPASGHRLGGLVDSADLAEHDSPGILELLERDLASFLHQAQILKGESDRGGLVAATQPAADEHGDHATDEDHHHQNSGNRKHRFEKSEPIAHGPLTEKHKVSGSSARRQSADRARCSTDRTDGVNR